MFSLFCLFSQEIWPEFENATTISELVPLDYIKRFCVFINTVSFFFFICYSEFIVHKKIEKGHWYFREHCPQISP